MVQFLQIIFFSAYIVQIVLNVQVYQNYTESKSKPKEQRYPIRWFSFILTSIISIALLIDIVIHWINKI
jgi:hypothetical protein